MSLHTTLMAVSLLAGGVDHAPTDATSSALNDTEKSFIDAIAAADRAEMELSRAVVARTANPAVRRLARTILDEDAANYHALFTICLNKTYAIAPQLDDRHREALRQLQDAAAKDNGVEHTYLQTIRMDKAGISEILQRISTDATDGELTRFAAGTLTMVQKHQL